jgi:hypothetical protein
LLVQKKDMVKVLAVAAAYCGYEESLTGLRQRVERRLKVDEKDMCDSEREIGLQGR